MVHYRTSSDSGELPGSTFLTLVTGVAKRLATLTSSQWGATRVHYPTTGNGGEPPGSTILSLVTVCVNLVHYLTSSDNGNIQVFLSLPLVAVG